MNRYDQLPVIVERIKPRTLVEVGTWNGERALILCRAALKHNAAVQYTGYDLFEDATNETDAAELNVKKHFSVADVSAKLDALKAEHPEFSYRLVKGNTRDTLHPKQVVADFAYIDGGHSVETIAGDFAALKLCKVVILDDYYIPDAAGKMPDISKFGCNSLLKGMDHQILPQRDPVRDGGMVQMAAVGVVIADRMRLELKTFNCVPDSNIGANIAYTHARKVPTFPSCEPHGRTAVICGSGPSLDDYKEQVKSDVAAGGTLVCVKSSYKKLIDEFGLVPWACHLLDPRVHVRDWVDPVRKDVLFLIASMIHPYTLDHLIEHGANIVCYNAIVGAGEQNVAQRGLMIGGGSTAACRAITVLYALGFRRFRLYGMDCSWPEHLVDWKMKDTRGQPRFLRVTTMDRDFITDTQLLAMVQDFQKMAALSLDIEIFGDGMLPHVWNRLNPPRSDFEGIFGDVGRVAA